MHADPIISEFSDLTLDNIHDPENALFRIKLSENCMSFRFFILFVIRSRDIIVYIICMYEIWRNK